MKLGQKQMLTVVKKVEFGVYLGTDEEKVLLPAKQVPQGIEPGDPLEVFLYKDSKDRLIATTNEPKLTLGQVALLEVAAVGKIGAFLDWGLEKDLFLPFKQQTRKVEKGDKCLVALYIDKSERLCATMRVYEYLRTDSPYQKDDEVDGTVYDINEKFGTFVAVDNLYQGLIPGREGNNGLHPGDHVHVRVSSVKEDGKMDLSLRKKAFLQRDDDAQKVLEAIDRYGGELPFTDKAAPERIKEEFGFGKNAFKRAVGKLLKEGKIEIREKTIAIR